MPLMRKAGIFALSVLGGALIVAFGTCVYRVRTQVIGLHNFPLGIVVALACVCAATVFLRSVFGWWGFAGAVVGATVLVQILAGTGPGGDVLIPQGGNLGYVWIFGSTLAGLAAAVAPRSLFRSTPVEP